MKVNYLLDCCGVKELSGLSYHATPQVAMRALCQFIYPDPQANKALVAKVAVRAAENKVSRHTFGYLGAQVPQIEASAVYEDPAQYSRFRFAIFSEAHRPGLTDETGPKYGRDFAALIRECKLGDVIETGKHINPNSSNNLRVWVWTVDHTALVAWFKKDAATLKKTQPTVSMFAGGNERWATPGTLSGEPGVNNQWVGNQTSNVTETVTCASGPGTCQPGNYETTAPSAPGPSRQG